MTTEQQTTRSKIHDHAKQHQDILRACAGSYQPSKTTPGMGMCCDGGRHDDRRVQLGRLGHRRHVTISRGNRRRCCARRDLASAICVERFKAAPDATAKLVEFKAIPDSYKKRQFVEAGGWATMPGQTTPDKLGVQGCVTTLASSS